MATEAPDEQVYYLWECGKCGSQHAENVLFCVRCAEAEGADNAEAAPNDKVGKITEAMMGAINWSLQNGQLKAAEVFSQAMKRGYPVAKLEDFQKLSLAGLDRIAGSFAAMNRAGATGTGIAAGIPGGLAGFVAIPADVAAVIYFALRCVSGVSQTYSFEIGSETGQVIELLAFAYASRMETTIIGTRRLENFRLARFLLENPTPYSALAKACIIKQLANYLALDFAKTSWATFLPIVGGVVNGTTNFFFVGEVNNRSKLFYRSLLLQIKPEVANNRPTAKAKTPAPPEIITIEVRELSLNLPGGELKASLICPAQTAELPLALVLWEGEGGRELAERLAEEGFAALLPEPALHTARLKELLQYLTENRLPDAPANLIAGKPAVLAFGNGATAVLGLLAIAPDSLSVAVLYNPVGESRKIVTNTPVLLQWCEDDPAVAKDWGEKLRSGDSNVPVTNASYSGAGHFFADSASPEYNPTLAHLAWADTLGWLKRSK